MGETTAGSSGHMLRRFALLGQHARWPARPRWTTPIPSMMESPLVGSMGWVADWHVPRRSAGIPRARAVAAGPYKPGHRQCQNKGNTGHVSVRVALDAAAARALGSTHCLAPPQSSEPAVLVHPCGAICRRVLALETRTRASHLANPGPDCPRDCHGPPPAGQRACSRHLTGSCNRNGR